MRPKSMTMVSSKCEGMISRTSHVLSKTRLLGGNMGEDWNDRVLRDLKVSHPTGAWSAGVK